MKPFEFRAADSFQAAATAIDHQSSMALGGGTTMLDLMKLSVLTPERVVFVKPHLSAEVKEVEGQLLIGAGCTMSQLAGHEIVRERFPAVRQSLITAASPQIRNMATIAGNLLQRTRTTYFRHTDMPADGLASGGQGSETEIPFGKGVDASCLAVLGNDGRLVGTYPGDFAITLLAFDGEVHLDGPDGKRVVNARDFYQLPKEQPAYSTVIKPNELIAAISLPLDSVAKNSLYLKIRERSSYAFALASASVGLELDGIGNSGIVKTSRVGLGGLGSIPWNSPEATKQLDGKQATDENFAAAADAALSAANPPAGAEYKVELAKRTLVRALQILRDTGPLDDKALWAMQHGR